LVETITTGQILSADTLVTAVEYTH